MRVNEVYEGDCLEVMAGFPDNCIDTILTDPPYGLEFMGKGWDYGIPGVAYWREALRVGKPGATLMAFGGTRTHHRLMVAIEDAGWEIRDVIMWVYGSGFPKSLDIGKAIDKAKGAEREVVGIDRIAYAKRNQKRASGNGKYFNYNFDFEDNGSTITAPSTPLAQDFDGWGTALKPAYEPIIIGMKPVDRNFAYNAEKWGVSGLNIDGGRIEGEKSGGSGQPPLKFNGQNHRPFHDNAIPRKFDTSQGRYPANLIHDGSDEIMVEFDKAGVRKSRALESGGRPRIKSNSLNNFPGKKIWEGEASQGSAARYFAHCPPDTEPARFIYQSKAPKSERSTSGNNHPTQKPLALIRYLAKLTKTPYGGIVLDPFAGSGTTAIAAIAENRDYIVIDKEPEYCELIKRRIAEYTGQEIAPVELKLKTETVKQLGLW